MVFKRAIVAELSNTAGAVFTVLFSIIFSVLLVRILGQAAAGTVDNKAVFALVALTVMTYLPTVLSLTMFVTVLLTITRMYRDSEMVVWFTSGQSLLGWIAPVLRFATPVIAVVAVLALVVSPWSSRQIAESKERFSQRDDVSRVAPGRFIESSNGTRVFFVETTDLKSAAVKNVFVNHRSQGREGVIVASEGLMEVTPEGDRYLVLGKGRRYEGVLGEPSYRTLEFDRYAIRIDAKPDVPMAEIQARHKSTLQLWVENTNWTRAELMWRIGLPIVTLLLVLLAIPLAYVNPRVGRSANLILAVFAFMLYHNGMSIVQAMVQQGRLSFGVGVWILHAIVAALVLLLCVRRIYMQRWLPRQFTLAYWRQRRGGVATEAA